MDKTAKITFTVMGACMFAFWLYVGHVNGFI